MVYLDLHNVYKIHVCVCVCWSWYHFKRLTNAVAISQMGQFYSNGLKIDSSIFSGR